VTDGLEEGSSSPPGATPSPNGVNFSVFSRHATGVQLLLFDRVDDTKPARVVDLDPSANRTYYYWHVFVPHVRPGQLYAYRVDGPFDRANGMRFDATKVLLDPYGRGVAVPEPYGRDAARGPGDTAGTATRNVVVDAFAYDWEGDTPLQRPSSQTIVYEMRVAASPVIRAPACLKRHAAHSPASSKRFTTSNDWASRRSSCCRCSSSIPRTLLPGW
jgi:isoamylase